MNERESFVMHAQDALHDFIDEHPEFSIDSEQPVYRGGTNYITLGHYGEQPIVFKSFVRTYRWSHEYFCLRHFARTGCVPRIFAIAPETLIVMTRLPDGTTGSTAPTLAEREQLSYQLGEAVGTLVQWPMPTVEQQPPATSEFEEFSWRSDIDVVMRHCVSLCRQIQQTMPVYQTPFFTASLDLVEAHIDYVAQQPRILFHEDISNFAVAEGNFQGFYDLEMVRVGTEAMQLGVVFDLIRPHWQENEWLVWTAFLRAYQNTTRQLLSEPDFRAALAMNHLCYHIRLCRWGKWDGDPKQTSNVDFATRMAEPYYTAMRRSCHSMKDWVCIDHHLLDKD